MYAINQNEHTQELFPDLSEQEYQTRQQRKAELVKELETLYGLEATNRVRFPADAVPHLSQLRASEVELFAVICLNGAHSITRIATISQGTINRTIVHPREVFRVAIMANSAAIIIAHNHPSGSLTPSMEDQELTIRLCKAGECLGIQILDHLVVSPVGYYSFLEHGKM